MAGKGIGGFGSQRTMEVPEGFTPEAFSWRNMSRKIVDGLADSWFEKIQPIAISETLTQQEKIEIELMAEAMPFFFGEIETKVLQPIFLQLSELGSAVPIDDSSLGKKLIAVLRKNNISWNFREERVELNAVSGLLMPSLKLEGAGQWGTYFGMPFDQVFKVFRDRTGKEKILWSADLLAATRPFEQLTKLYSSDEETNERYLIQNDPEALKKGGLTFGQWSTKVHIPIVLKWLFYLAETPFPSVILNFSRTLSYGEEFPETLIPKPYFLNKTDSRVSGAFDLNDQGYLASAAKMPNVIEAGWIIEDMSEEELSVCINIASSGLTRMMTILEDGYLNHSSADSHFGWDEALRSAVVLDSDCQYGIDAAGLSTWIPVCRVGFALNNTYVKAPHALKSGALGELEDIAFNGAGPLVANCINSLVFSHLMDSEYYYMIDRLLEAAFLMNVGEESTNALSNWGIALYKRGELDEAMSKFEQALEREDKYAEAEASWWLSKIYTELGNAKKSAEFEKRCREAGGYGEPNDVEPVNNSKIGSLSSETSNGSGLLGQSKFCSNCGSVFQANVNFCSNCGSKRL